MTDRAALARELRQTASRLEAAAKRASATKAPIPATKDFDEVKADLGERLKDAFSDYLLSSGSVTSFRNAARRALLEDISAAFYSGYVEAAGEGAETEDEDEAALNGILSTQLDYMGGAFDKLKAQRQAEEFTLAEVDERVDDWLNMLSGVYAEGKLRGDKNKMLTFDGDDGKESCDDCQKYKGQRHSAGWWLKHDLVRRNGNENFACGRWKPCQHFLYDDNGDLYA